MAEYPLEPDRAAMEAIGRAALDYAADYIEARSSAPASRVDDDAWALADRLLHTAPPDTGRPFAELLATIDEAAAGAFDTTGPGYLAFIPGGGLYTSAIAGLLANVTNRFINIAAPAPAFVAMEASVVRWLCDTFGYDDAAQGILTSGGSMANFSAIVAARADRLGEQFLDGTMYVTEQTHQSVAKAAMLA